MHFKKPLRHVGRIREHLAVGDNHLERRDDFARGVGGSVLYVSDAFCRLIIPYPHIVKRFDLRLEGESTPSEDGMILLLRVERRIQADEVDAFIREVAHDVEAVAVVKCVRLELDVHRLHHVVSASMLM